MNKVPRSIVFVSTLVALASLGSAQVLSGAANAAGRVNVPAVPPPPPPPAVSVGAASAASAAVRAPVMPASTALAGNVQSGGNASPSTGVNANAITHASAQGQASGLSVAAITPGQTSVTVNTSETVKTIRTATFAARDSVTADVQARLDASVQHCAAMQARADASGEKSREAFAKALVAVRQQEKELRTSLRAAVKASGETSWGEIQSALAKDYGAYAEAVAHAEATAQGPVTPKS